MARIWSDRQLERATPTQAKDIRGKAFLSAVNRLLGDRSLPGPHIRDPETCPAEVLPALVAEYSMEEFIEPGLPEHVVRRILKKRWALQIGEGYDAGVKLGLSLLDMTGEIIQWHEEVPMGEPNTHRITFEIGSPLFLSGQTYFGERETRAAMRMIDATKRWSQHSKIVFKETFEGRGHLRSGSRQARRSELTHVPATRGHTVTPVAALSTGLRQHRAHRAATDATTRTHAVESRPLRHGLRLTRVDRFTHDVLRSA